MSIERVQSAIDSSDVWDQPNCGYALVGVLAITMYSTILPATEILYFGSITIAGSIFGVIAAWRGVSWYYRQWIIVFPAIGIGGLLIWYSQHHLVLLPIGIAFILTSVERVVVRRKDLFFAIATLGFLTAGILAVVTASLPVVLACLLAATWMAKETYDAH